MNEGEVIEAAGGPHTHESIREGLTALGLPAGATVLVHSSLSRLGWVAGGAHAVVLALVDVLGAMGTLVMPTHSTHLSDPAGWAHPPVPETWWPVVREATPAFDPALTPTRGMGAIVECFRHLPGVVRSTHPTLSFAAVGPRATEIVGAHSLNDGLGEASPLARLYDADGWVLLLGVGHQNNTSLHLAEHRADFPGKKRTTQGSPMLVDGVQEWVQYQEIDPDDSDFPRIGAEFAGTGKEREGPVGGGTARLMRQREAVDFATAWLGKNRLGGGRGRD